MLESVRNVGFLTKACAAAACLCGLYIILTVFYTSDFETNEYINYRHRELFFDLNNSLKFNLTERINVLGLLKYYSNATAEADINEVMFTNKALEPCPETSPFLGKFTSLLIMPSVFTPWY